MLRRLWRRWSQFGQWLGNLVARLVLTVFYFTLALPFGLLTRAALDPLRGKRPTVGWVPRTPDDAGLLRARKMY